MRAPSPAARLALLVVASIGVWPLACSSSDDGGSSSTASPDASSEGASLDASADAANDRAAIDAPSLDASPDGAIDGASDAPDPNAPSITAVTPIVATQNTVTALDADKLFVITDPGGVAGMTVTAVASDPAHVMLGAPQCNGGACAMHVQLAPAAAGTSTVTLSAKNARGLVGTRSFDVNVSPLLVTSGADSGNGTLRDTLAACAVGDVIGFAPSITKVQLEADLAINKVLTIAGPGAAKLTIDLDASYQGITTYADPVALSGFTVTNAHIGIVVFSGKLLLDACTVTGNTIFGLAVNAGAGHDAAAVVSGSVFSSNGVGAIAYLATGAGTAVIDATGSTFTANGTGIGVSVAEAGQVAAFHLNGGNTIQASTKAGVLLEMNNGVGDVSVAIPGSGGASTNSITGNPIGISRSGPVPSAAITLTPVSQVSGNTTDFAPAWP